ncbi:peptidylprolyl isomerase [Candidatus Falkowbacteria bacterium HGW-Falkowbacteria-1]|uniref:Peptidyl-prolyl cis-trans isomerase n=1 Tax=Candidatus Falkowbacteria bacterium HGW-Falkowbacteria-1 TaxID=2013768 RepID=A0A2N2EA07_9BACT|nr:MAG: peptidylprolyl isomerase [Candidatus Falkowbacteria bacterium HGW-Falkowbacteria-1]
MLNQEILKKYSQVEFVTSEGNFTIEFYNEKMPITVSNFLNLAESGYFDGMKFHRVISDFMIQGGDPLTKDDSQSAYWGTGGPGYAIADEHVAGLSNLKGTISMANSGPNSGGSQFFINVKDNTFLDFDKEPSTSKHPVFGKVISGMDVVEKISLVDTIPGDRPATPVVINKLNLK